MIAQEPRDSTPAPPVPTSWTWRLRAAASLVPSWVTVAAIGIFLVGTIVRVSFAIRHVDSPMIDENEVVEQAAAFMGDDRRFYFLKYGPFTMYVLAGIYRVAAFVHGLTPLEYASRVFFEGSEHYLIARVYVVGSIAVLALLAFVSFRRLFGAGPALLVLSLLSFPLFELLAIGARIDLPQAAFQGAALLALGEVVARPGRLRYWLLAGACAGFAVATKPLPGLLIAPCFVLASWLEARQRKDGTPRGWTARLGAAVASPGLWLAALAVAACAFLGNPAMLDIRQFIESQQEAVALHSGDKLHARQNVADSLLRLRLPFLLAGAVSAVLVVLRPSGAGRLPLLFIVVYLAALQGRASRDYFLVAPAVACCLLIGHGWVAGRELLSSKSPKGAAWARSPWAAWAWAPLALLLLERPMESIWSRWQQPHHASLARQWIYENIPTGTRMFFLGWRPSGPWLVAAHEKVQSRWGDHFDYGRSHYAFLKQAFHLGYENYAKSGQPRYALTVHDDLVYPRKTKRTPRRISDGLLKESQDKQIKYIILAGYREARWQDLGYPWFSLATVEREFGKIIIFRVPEPAPPAQTSTVATPLTQ
jgi:dolichyl-phosphate-mannose-protein mannosyltransferase